MKAAGGTLTFGELVAELGLDLGAFGDIELWIEDDEHFISIDQVVADGAGLSLYLTAGTSLAEAEARVLLYDLIDRIVSSDSIGEARDAAENAADEIGYNPGGRG
jgi:hypothetical protein